MADFGTLQNAQRLATVRLEVESETVELTFDVYRVTEQWMDMVIADALAQAGISWNMTLNGEPMPLTRENVARFPYAIQHALMREVIDAAVPSSEEGNASNATSSSASTDYSPTPVSPPNGQEPSPSRQSSTVASTT